MKCAGDMCLLYNDGLCTYSKVIIVPDYQCPCPGGYRPSNAPANPIPPVEQRRNKMSRTVFYDSEGNEITDTELFDSANEPDMVNQPPHYTQGGVECIDAIQAAVTGKPPYEAWLTGQIIKYVWRYNFKNGKQDLEKAEFYLKRLIDIQEKADE